MAEASLRAVALARRLQGLEKVRRTFISEAAHELNTPLTPLRIHVEALGERSDLNDAQRAHVEAIERNAKRLCVLVEGLLEVARNESDRLVLDMADIPLSLALGAAIREMAPVGAEAGITLDLLPPRGSLVAQGDRPAIAKVLRTLLGNAIRFTPPGGRVTVSAHPDSTDVVVQVADSGVGLTREQIQLLFQPFARPHEGQAFKAQGAGLGLFVARGLVERQGGRMWAESPGPGKGSSFFFTLRREPVPGT